ncbi:SDR family NAD(P)-dependent oxidoreductase, partial [Nocardia sp. NPDC088792]|uniref:SDR family NAD(P)-dependent oxidoreductase n=1 Tax=Nocardia sp. NPDC088792 TaxID=3364332 RepID=UPI00380D3544
MRLLTEQQSWPETGRPRRAGVSSFGMSGTNAHVILEAAPDEAAAPEADESTSVDGFAVWVVSGRSDAAVRDQAARLLPVVADLSAIDVGAALLSRSVFDHRAVVVGADRDELLSELQAVADGTSSVGAAKSGRRVVFVFPGQGAQWAGMAAGLLESSAVFRESMMACAEALAPFVDWSLLDVVGDAAALERVEVVQPVLWAMMVSLAAVWRSYGVEPAAVVGHSQGEIAAACVAGGLSLSDGARVVALRSRVIAEVLAGVGGMVAVSAPSERVREILAGLDGAVVVAAINGPSSVVVAGPVEDLEVLLAHCEVQGVWARRVPVDYASHTASVEVIRDRLLQDLVSISPRTGAVPMYSALTGSVIDTAELSGRYWFDNGRNPVLFQDATEALVADGFTVFVEVSAHPVLTAAIEDTIGGADVVVTGTLRRDDGGLDRFLRSAGDVFVAGVAVDWGVLFAGQRTGWVDLPAYAFQHRHYWPKPPTVVGRGLVSTVVPVPGSDTTIFSSRVSLQSAPWLADHAVNGVVVFPGTGFVELAFRAADVADGGALAELVVHTPLVISQSGETQLQTVLTGGSIEIYARVNDDDLWTRHVTATTRRRGAEPAGLGAIWPPTDSVPLDIADFYIDRTALGFSYGPAFQGLTAAWRHDGHIYAEIELPENERLVAGEFGIHPALLDAALQPSVLTGLDESGNGRLPFSFTDVTLHTVGATAVRVRVSPTGPGSVSAVLVDEDDVPVFSVGSLILRPLVPETLSGVTPAGSLLGLDWVPVSDVTSVSPEPSAVLDVQADASRTVETTVQYVLSKLRDFAGGCLVVVTHEAVAAAPDDTVWDLAAAAVWGLVRSAQSEDPGRFVLLDLEAGTEPTSDVVARAIATGEPQLALRGNSHLAPRLSRLTGNIDSTLQIDGTVLITGGTGGLGQVVARHLVARHGVRSLLLLSRRGSSAPGADELYAELSEQGVDVRIVACDVSDRASLSTVLDGVVLAGVVHTAGVLDDGMIANLTDDQIHNVFAPKVDAAWHLHELTRDQDLTFFAVFSSLAGTLGSPGQGNYAAANVFLDAMISHRRSAGLPGISLAWGPWDQAAGLTGGLTETDVRRLAQLGMQPVAADLGMDLFDRALTTGRALVGLTELNIAALRTRDDAPSVFRGLVGAQARRARGRGNHKPAGFIQGFAFLSEEERQNRMTALVRGLVASVLGFGSADEVAVDRPFRDIGFDSLTAVELRNVLQRATGVTLPSTLVFDYPSVDRLVAFLDVCLGGSPTTTRIDAVELPMDGDPLVVVGMGCRFPGGVQGPGGLWDLVAVGV